MLPRIHEVPEGYRPYMAEAIGRAVGVRQVDFVAFVATIEAVPPEAQEHFTMGYGVELRARPVAVLPDVSALRQLPPSLRRWCSFGVGRLLREGCVGWDAARCRAVLDSLEQGDAASALWIYRGAGAATAADWVGDPAIDVWRIGSVDVPPSHRGDFAWGVGWGIRDAFKEDILRTKDWVAHLLSVERVAALEGVRAYDAFYRLEAELDAQPSR